MFEASITQKLTAHQTAPVGARNEPYQYTEDGAQKVGSRRIYSLGNVEDITIKLPDDLGALRLAYDSSGELMLILIDDDDPETDGEILYSWLPENDNPTDS